MKYSRYVAVMLRLPWNLLPQMQSSQNLSSPLTASRYILNLFNDAYLNPNHANLQSQRLLKWPRAFLISKLAIDRHHQHSLVIQLSLLLGMYAILCRPSSRGLRHPFTLLQRPLLQGLGHLRLHCPCQIELINSFFRLSLLK